MPPERLKAVVRFCSSEAHENKKLVWNTKTKKSDKSALFWWFLKSANLVTILSLVQWHYQYKCWCLCLLVLLLLVQVHGPTSQTKASNRRLVDRTAHELTLLSFSYGDSMP